MTERRRGVGRERPKEKKCGREMPHACQRPGVGSPRRGGPCVHEERPEGGEEGKLMSSTKL